MSAGRHRPTVKLEVFGSTQDSKCHYVVITGKRPGIYTDVAEARQQLEAFPDSNYMKCEDFASAVDLLRRNGAPDNDIRLFRGAFEPQSDFIPNPTATFKDEFERFSGTQQWTKQQERKARVDAIRDEIIKHCLPYGVRIGHSQDDGEYVHLDKEQYLEVYQAICRTARKPVHLTIDECLVELKAAPFVNILDFIDFFRTGQKLRTFSEWDEFKKYTLDGRTMAIDYARENELLAPILQNFRRGPGATDPLCVKPQIMARRTEDSQERKYKPTSTPLVLTAELPRDLSPSVFDRTPSSPVSELLDDQLSVPGSRPSRPGDCSRSTP
ncbi:hypothetical protein DE146DRAFT_443648 [Phaeosphaeria sp. MPI-PUGE-AT-0046c]|nr:hypothetical protein DE146DRAFT_443648 [Phaeosphaeria sp. MPI-PUGE-AT-0046c]